MKATHIPHMLTNLSAVSEVNSRGAFVDLQHLTVQKWHESNRTADNVKLSQSSTSSKQLVSDPSIHTMYTYKRSLQHYASH